MNKLAIVIVNWNTGDLLAKCLLSLTELPAEERALIDEVLVVDNASHDKSVAKAKVVVGQAINDPPVRFIQLDENRGYAAGNNVALSKVNERHGKWIHCLLLNPDTEVKAGAISGMLDLFDRREKAGIVGPRLLNRDGTNQDSVRMFPTFKTFVWFFLRLHRIWGDSKFWRSYMMMNFDYGHEQEVDQVMGAAFLIRDAVLVEIGKLDEDYYVWFEEVDYCLQAAKAGWQTVYTPSGNIVHVGAISFEQLVSWKKTRLWLKSSLVYAGKNLTGAEVMWLRLLWPLALLLYIPTAIRRWINRLR